MLRKIASIQSSITHLYQQWDASGISQDYFHSEAGRSWSFSRLPPFNIAPLIFGSSEERLLSRKSPLL